MLFECDCLLENIGGVVQLSASSTFAARKSIEDSVVLSSDGDVDQMKSSSVVVDVQKLVIAC